MAVEERRERERKQKNKSLYEGTYSPFVQYCTVLTTNSIPRQLDTFNVTTYVRQEKIKMCLSHKPVHIHCNLIVLGNVL